MSFTVVVSPYSACPSCGCTATVQVACAEPEPGDLVICIGCELICILTPGGPLRMLTPTDLEYYALDDIARAASGASDLRAAYLRRN